MKNQQNEAAAWMQLARSHKKPKAMFNNKQLHDFCNLMMRLPNAADHYIKVIGKKRELDTHQMANEFIYQHAMEDTVHYDDVLYGVTKWWETYINRDKFLKA